MPEHEPLNIDDLDREAPVKPEARAARVERKSQAAHDGPNVTDANIHSDQAQVDSEPMELQRLADSRASVPPGRQRTGDPPAPTTDETS
ncbi:MAG: hypothetical protein NVSMB2_26790 [Chloroflexota bacterium]